MATGSRTKQIDRLLGEELQRCANRDQEYVLMSDSDFSLIIDQCRKMAVNIAIGHSEGKILTERLGIPLVRYGFPIHDRMGGQRLLSAGYQGSLAFLDRITNTLLENKYRNYRTKMFEKYYPLKSPDQKITAQQIER